MGVFGTDGVRGLANKDLTAELALDLSVAAARVLGQVEGSTDRRPTAVVARDTRVSGEFLEAAVVAGLASAGVDVRLVGVVPTPAAAHLTDVLDVDLGVMISASHNPMPDNGIKFLARGGVKLDDALEDRISDEIGKDAERPLGGDVGRIRHEPEAVDSYVDHLLETLAGGSLAGLDVVLDCANGAAHRVGPEAFERAGATVHVIHAEPDGLNINENCGSTHLDDLQAKVRELGADVGFAFDGDADRCLAVDASGEVVDGDQILAILALRAQRSGRLTGGTVVSTVMSNLGFIRAMEAAGINVVQAAVGDRYVLEEMSTGGFVLGGEQSGHVIMAEHATTGDGVLTALHIALEIAQSSTSMAQLAAVMTRFPQVLLNVPDVDRSRVGSDSELQAAVAAAGAELGDSGRVLLRPSGTEPVVRVMVEASSLEAAHRHAESLAEVVRLRLGI